MSGKKRVLVLCTGNSCRSQMAKGAKSGKKRTSPPFLGRRLMMKQMSISIVILAMVLLMACTRSSETHPVQATSADSGTLQPSPPPPQSSQDSVVFLKNQEGATPAQAPPASTVAGMNPPHGQPGHRCDIAVGAPLSSPPGRPPAPPAVSQQAVQPQTANAQTAPGMNPPHGQPGHRCDIPVGSPLDSPQAINPGAATTPETSPIPEK
jgi:hypothetical protein